MYHTRINTNPTYSVIRWAARITSILFLAIFVWMLFGTGLNVSEATPREWLSLLFFPLGASIGMILAWWREGLGGAITVVCVVISILIDDPSAGGAYMFACASPGFLFLLSWMLSLSIPNLKEDAIQEPRKNQ